MKRFIVCLNIFCLFHLSVSADQQKSFVVSAMVKEVAKEIEVNGHFYYPDKYNSRLDSEIPVETQKGHDELIAKFSDLRNNIDELKDELISELNKQSHVQLNEMNYVLSLMDSSTLDRLFDRSFDRGYYSDDLEYRYNLAFTSLEKRRIISSMISMDINQLKSSQIKRVSLSTRDQLIQELSLSKTFLLTENKKIKRTTAIILTVIAAGIVTWAMTSMIKSHFEKKTSDMNDDFDNAETQAEKEYAQKTKDLIAEYELRAELRESGYVWAVCNERRLLETSSCIFDHTVHTGEKVCVTRCLKNPETGDERFAVESCSSAFIPNNCHIKNQYDTGWDNGYDDGYDDGYDRAYDSAYEDAYADFYYRNYDRGYSNGYDYGYSAGYSDGYDEAVYDDSLEGDDFGEESIFTSAKGLIPVKGFTKGYRDGYRHAQKFKLGLL